MVRDAEYRALLMVRRGIPTEKLDTGPGEAVDYLYKRALEATRLEATVDWYRNKYDLGAPVDQVIPIEEDLIMYRKMAEDCEARHRSDALRLSLVERELASAKAVLDVARREDSLRLIHDALANHYATYPRKK